MEVLLTIREVLNRTTKYFSGKGIESARLDAEVLLAKVLGVNRIDLYINYDRPLVNSELDAYRRVVAERGQRKPIPYITGEKEFMSLNFKVMEGVLIPRPETEILVEAALKYVKKREIHQPTILDIGTGTGCIAVSLAKRLPSASIYATDISTEALKVAKTNAREHDLIDRITFLQGDLFEPIAKLSQQIKFDLIVSNPPYIRTQELKELPPEIKYEPFLALNGGKEGLVYYERILDEAPGYLKLDGLVLFEVGAGQAHMVQDISRNFNTLEIIKDYSSIERVLMLTMERRG